jgi:hypothetical protein
MGNFTRNYSVGGQGFAMCPVLAHENGNELGIRPVYLNLEQAVYEVLSLRTG